MSVSGDQWASGRLQIGSGLVPSHIDRITPQPAALRQPISVGWLEVGLK
jgi:hypothetical protein